MIRKHLFTALLLLAGMSLFAQEGTQNIGINVGYSTAILREQSDFGADGMKGKALMYGYKIGAVYETTLIKGFGMQLGLNYTYGSNIGKWVTDPKSKIHQYKDTKQYHQIELPIDWQYKFEIAKETYLTIYTGPTLQLGIKFANKHLDKNVVSIGGDVKTTETRISYYSSTDMGDQDKDGRSDAYSRFNITWGVGLGFQYQRYFLRGGYDFGIYSPYRDAIWNNYTADNDWYRRGRFDQWALKLGIYLWQTK